MMVMLKAAAGINVIKGTFSKPPPSQTLMVSGTKWFQCNIFMIAVNYCVFIRMLKLMGFTQVLKRQSTTKSVKHYPPKLNDTVSC